MEHKKRVGPTKEEENSPVEFLVRDLAKGPGEKEQGASMELEKEDPEEGAQRDGQTGDILGQGVPRQQARITRRWDFICNSPEEGFWYS